MAGMTCNITEEKWGELHKIVFDWLSDDANGTASGTTTNAYSGILHRVVFFPDPAATQPTNQYDVVLNDADGYDVLAGAGADLSNTLTVHKLQSVLGSVKADKLTLGVSNAGNVKGGVVTVYVLSIE